MNKNFQSYFTTGEFCKLTKTTKHTLFHYDKIGLFSPSKVNDKGYRYYSSHQIELFYTIELLKKIGLSLSEIKVYLKNRNPENILSLLTEIEDKINEEMKRLHQVEKFIKTKKESLQSALNIDKNEIKVAYCNRKYFLLSDKIPNKATEKQDVTILQNLIIYCKDNNITTFNPIGGIGNVDENIFESLSYYYVTIEQPIKSDRLYEKPAGNYLIAYYKGSDDLNDTYKRIMDYINKHNLKTEQFVYGDTVIDDFYIEKWEDYLIEISIRVI